MKIGRELFEKLCVFFARLDLDLMKGVDLCLSPNEVRDIQRSWKNFLTSVMKLSHDHRQYTVQRRYS